MKKQPTRARAAVAGVDWRQAAVLLAAVAVGEEAVTVPDIDLMVVVLGYAGIALALDVPTPGLADPGARLPRVHTRDWAARKSPVAAAEVGGSQQQPVRRPVLGPVGLVQ